MGHGQLAEGERGRDVEVERPLEHALARVEERPGARAAGVVHHHVDASELRHRPVDELLEVRGLAHVARHDDGATSRGTHVGSHLVELVLRARRDHHVGAGGRESAGDGRADSPPGPGDYGDAVGEHELVEDHYASNSLRPSVAHQLAVRRRPATSPRGWISSYVRL